MEMMGMYVYCTWLGGWECSLDVVREGGVEI